MRVEEDWRIAVKMERKGSDCAEKPEQNKTVCDFNYQESRAELDEL